MTRRTAQIVASYLSRLTPRGQAEADQLHALIVWLDGIARGLETKEPKA
jgi:hypothetical protein